MPRHWYVAVVNPGSQDRIERNLRVQEFFVFNPRVRRKQPKRDGSYRYRVGPYFPGYMFLRIDVEEDDWVPVLAVRGVHGFIKNETALPHEKPQGRAMMRVRQGVVPAMIAQYGDDFVVDERKIEEAIIRSGDLVRIRSGAYAGREAVAMDSTHSKIIFILELFGREHRVGLPRDHFDLVTGENR